MGEGIYENLMSEPTNFSLTYERSTEYADKKELLKSITSKARSKLHKLK